MASVLQTYAIDMDFTYEGIKYTTRGMPEGECATLPGFHSATPSTTYAGNENATGDIIIPEVVYAPSGPNYRLTVTKISERSFQSIKYGAYANNNSITSIVIPNTVTSIEKYAFSGNPLKKIVVGKNVGAINLYAFSGSSPDCEAYFLSPTAPFVVAGSASTQGEFAVLHVPYQCKNAYANTYWDGYNGRYESWPIVDDADIAVHDDIIYQFDPVAGNHATVIGATNEQITKATILRSVKTPLNKVLPVTDVSDRAFENKNSLQEVIIPDGLITIGEYAFYNCRNLGKVSLGNTVKTIKSWSFSWTGLKSLGLPSSVETIESRAFSSNKNLEYVMLGKGLKTIGSYAFAGCEKVSEVEIEDLASWCGVSITDEYANPMLYSNCFSIRGKEQTSLNIPSGVERIKRYTFAYCTSIKELNLSPYVKTIDNYAFKNSGLTKIENTGNVTSIGEGAFGFCKDLESVVLSEPMQQVGNNAFRRCEALKTVTIARQLQSTGGQAFIECKALSSIDVGQGLGEIGYNAFGGCDALTSVNASNISGWCSQNFGNEKSNPLYYAGKLTIGNAEASDIKMDRSVVNIPDYAFVNCTSLNSVDTGEGVNSIGKNAFAGCSGLKELRIGNNVRTIGNDACNGAANLTSVFFGKGLTTMGSGLFLGCINLRTLNAQMNQAPLQTEACFEDIAYSNATLYVMPSSYSTYRITEPWKGFRRIYECEIMIDEKSLGIENGKRKLDVGDSLKIDVTTEPASLQNELEWTSTDSEVATVENGVVKALHIGLARITVKAGEISKTIAFEVTQKVESVSLNREQARVKVGGEVLLRATVLPNNASDPSVTWSSSNPAVAPVEDGIVDARSVGTAVITVTTSNGLTASCHVEVYEPALGIAIDFAASGIEGEDLTMAPGEEKELKVAVYPQESSDALTWTSSDESVVTVQDGLVKAIAVGTATVTVRAESGVETGITVNVVTPVTSISLDCEHARLCVGEGLLIQATILPENAANRSVRWSSSNPDVAFVGFYGNVAAKSPGSAVITATASNGMTAKCYIDVYQGAEGISIDFSASGIEGDELTMAPGESKEIKVRVTPDDAIYSLTWTSSNESVARVQDGVVEALAVGTATVTVRADNGVWADIRVRVGYSSIDDIIADSCTEAEVFNMQGLRIFRNATKADLQTLSPGIYIVRTAIATGKIVIR